MTRPLRALLLWIALAALAGCAGTGVLYDRPSAYSRIIVTEDAQGRRTLVFDTESVRQSVSRVEDPGHLELPYARVAMVALAFVPAPRRILVVGLGGATLPRFLRLHYPEAEIDVVEIDPDVVTVARRYFGFEEDARMRAHVADGRRFIEELGAPRYDIVLLDAFGARAVPPHLTTAEFLRAVRRVVNRDAVVAGNVWRRGFNPLYDAMVRTYQEVFDELYIVEATSAVNDLLFALPRSRSLSADQLARAAREVSQKKQLRFDLGALVERSFRLARERDPSAKVLTDADLRVPEGIR